MSESANPLSWPTGWPRSKSRRRAAFRNGNRGALSVAQAGERLQQEVQRLGAIRAVLSSNLRLRIDGFPRSDLAEPQDPGAAAYFTLKGRRVVLACDKWDRVADNIAAIAAHIEALRGQERWGVGTLERAFTGYATLPSPEQAKSWRTVLGCPDATNIEEVETRYKQLSMIHHPDIQGGSHEQMAELTNAIAEARRELKQKVA